MNDSGSEMCAGSESDCQDVCWQQAGAYVRMSAGGQVVDASSDYQEAFRNQGGAYVRMNAGNKIVLPDHATICATNS